LKNYVREHLEVDDEELPDTILNVYLQDAFERTVALDNRWPRNENTWDVSKVVDSYTVTLPLDMSIPSIISVLGTNSRRLGYMSDENLEDMFFSGVPTATGEPQYWTVWQGQLLLMPNPGLNVAYDLTIRGYRQPVWSNAASTIPDIDARLHPAMAYYAMSLSYAAQEDEVLEGVYMARWDRDCRGFMKAILDPPRHRPVVLNGAGRAYGVPAYIINAPGG
jgi:hypothetical protein